MKPKDPSIVDHDMPIIQTILRYTAEGSDKRNDLQIEMISFSGKRDQPQFAIAGVLEYQHGRGALVLASADPDAAAFTAAASGENLEYFDPVTNESFVPWIVETSAGADRAPFTFLIDAYREEEVRGPKTFR